MAQNRAVVFNQLYVASGGTQGWQAEADWGTFAMGIILLRNDGPGLGQEWIQRTTDELREIAVNLDEAKTSYGLVEISAVGYARQQISGTTITKVTSPGDHGRWNLASDTVIFGANVAAGQTIEGILVYGGPVANILNPVNDAEHELLFMREYATGQATQDSQVSAKFPNQYLFALSQAPDV